MLTLKDLLNGLAFILTIVLVTYGFTKGYDLIELSIYNLYFIVIIIVQINVALSILMKCCVYLNTCVVVHATL